MALFLDPNNQGGGIVAEENSEQGIHINSDSTWYIESKYNWLEGQTLNTRLMTEGRYFSIYHYLGDINDSPEVKATFELGGAGAVGLSGTYPESDGIEQQPRIGLGTANEALSLEVEYNSTAQSNGIYINSANTEKAGISFVDNTVNPENPTKRYYLKDFALKSDLSSVDLTNYQGDWKLSNPKTPNTTSTGNNYGATNASIETIDLATDVEPEHRPQAILIRSCQSSQSETTPIHDSGIYVNYAGTSLYQVINDGSIFDVSSNTYTGYVQRTYPGVMAYEEYEAGQTPEVIASIRMDLIGIRIKDTTIQEDEFTLKSLVDRIAALEAQVSELQTQLAAKANTNSPTFTGKVTINSITE